jgi:hypothetical protein
MFSTGWSESSMPAMNVNINTIYSRHKAIFNLQWICSINAMQNFQHIAMKLPYTKSHFSTISTLEEIKKIPIREKLLA